jgi:hypothetical protein
LINANNEIETGVPPVYDLILPMFEEVALGLVSGETLAHQLPFQRGPFLHGQIGVVLSDSKGIRGRNLVWPCLFTIRMK